MITKPTPATAPVTIARMGPIPPAQDFDALMEQAAREWLPAWCAGIWTDFNYHDPGIMILEQVIYASTELSYRAGFPIERLLRDQNGDLHWRENSIYPPTEILPMQPLTADDYARLLYDRVPHIVHAKIEALPAAGCPAPAAAGRLRARIAPDPKLTPKEAQRVVEAAERLLHRHCNLGERFEQVVAEPAVFFSVEIQAQLTTGASSERIRASLYLAIEHALAPGAQFRTLAQARTGESIADALTGPLLDHGVIEDDDLPKLLTWAKAQARATQAIRSVPGLRAIASLTFTRADPSVDGKAFYVPLPDIRLNDGRGVGGNAANADRSLIALGRENPDVQFRRLLPGSDWEMPEVPDAPTSEVGVYTSLQNSFPPCFGIQQDGLPSDAPPLRRAQARQLKGYLLVFEQLMADYFAQLEHTADYFSNQPQKRTIFTQPLATVPDVMPLLDGYRFDDQGATPAEKAAHAKAYWADPSNPYVTGLAALAGGDDHFLRRRGRILDQLLARFNESFPATDEEPTFETIRNKEDVLREYPRLGSQRAAAADVTEGARAGHPRPRSGLEQKIQLLLRRDTQPEPPALDELSAKVRPERPADFYFVLEPIRFLPRAATGPLLAAEAVWTVPADAFQPSLFHVFINWTYQPLDDAFQSYVAELVQENAPAHLWPRFVWLETRPHPAEDTIDFLARFTAWAEAGYPPLELAAPPAGAPADMIVVRGNTPAAQLFQWLLAHAPAET